MIEISFASAADRNGRNPTENRSQSSRTMAGFGWNSIGTDGTDLTSEMNIVGTHGGA